MIVITDIFRGIVERVSKEYGKHISYMFGDWNYISDQLLIWSKSNATAKLKYPAIFLYSPIEEDRTDKKWKMSLSLLLVVNTLPSYTNEERSRISFAECLRPIYEILIKEIGKEPTFDMAFVKNVPHMYIENYRYGKAGVTGPDGKPFKDYIDGINIKNLQITLKKEKCYGDRI
nr:MAG: hypothetical protein [Bacteriophage sp.]